MVGPVFLLLLKKLKIDSWSLNDGFFIFNCKSNVSFCCRWMTALGTLFAVMTVNCRAALLDETANVKFLASTCRCMLSLDDQKPQSH